MDYRVSKENKKQKQTNKQQQTNKKTTTTKNKTKQNKKSKRKHQVRITLRWTAGDSFKMQPVKFKTQFVISVCYKKIPI